MADYQYDRAHPENAQIRHTLTPAVRNLTNQEKIMTKITSLEKVLECELKDLYSAELQILKALPKMAKKAESESLQEAFSAHLKETEKHVERLEKIAEILEISLTGKTCKAMKGLLEEGAEVLDEKSENPALLDVMLIGAAQRVEHYEMAAYGTARAIAEQLGLSKVAQLLQTTLNEEGEADKKLTDICEGEIFLDADPEQSDKEGDSPSAHR